MGIGCGDSLFSGDRLEDLFGHAPLPERPAWELRWLSDAGELVSDCRLSRAEIVDDEDVVFGEALVSTPRAEPVAWVQTEGARARWALGLPVLVDRSRYHPAVGEPEASLEAGRGFWGVAFGQAVLFSDGEVGDIEDELQVAIEGSPQWVELIAPAVATDGRVEGRLLQGERELEELWVLQVDHLDELDVIWTGEVFEGLSYEGCE